MSGEKRRIVDALTAEWLRLSDHCHAVRREKGAGYEWLQAYSAAAPMMQAIEIATRA